MAAMSDWLEAQLLDHVLRNTAMASPASVFVALFLDDPTDAGTGTEVSGGSYARQAVSFGSVVAGETSNSGLITFPTATADWGEITHAAIYTLVSGGNMLFHAELSDAELVSNGGTFTIPIGQLVVSLQ